MIKTNHNMSLRGRCEAPGRSNLAIAGLLRSLRSLAMTNILFFLSVQIVFAGKLTITKDFKEEILQTDFGEANSQSVIEILRSHANIKTEFGGGYVSLIENHSETEQSHWFYYVNGILADKGAALHHPTSHDYLWWDLHSWKGERYLGAVIGAWPEPFLSGYNGKIFPTQIWVSEAFKSSAETLQKALLKQGVSSVQIVTLESKTKINFEDSFPIYIGTWPELEKNTSFEELFKHAEQVGLFLRYDANGITVLDWEGKSSSSFKQAGVLVALKSAYAGGNPIWFVSGTDAESVKRVLNLLIEHPEQIQNRPGILVTEKEIFNVPSA